MKLRLAAFCLLVAVGCSGRSAPSADAKAADNASDVASFDSEHGTVDVLTVVSGLEHPWSLAFLPDGRMLVTERPGRLRLLAADGRMSPPLQGVPIAVARGQGGLLDIALDPDFTENQWLYLSFSEAGDGGVGTSVYRAVFDGERLHDGQVIFRQEPKLQGGAHFGSRLVFDRAGHLFVTTGDRMNWPNVQRLDRGQGKLYRIWPDGRIPDDNPFVGRADAIASIWSYGHRNAQGATLHPDTGELWETEHGARGGDELNVVRAGRNYGWPVITWGVNYDGEPIGSGKAEMSGMEQPLHYWTPSIAPSGLAFYTAERFPAWKGNLFVGALAHQKLVRLQLEGERVVHAENLLEGLHRRIRDVRQGPDGYLYLLTDEEDGRVLRIGLRAAKP
jgi:glucose/arabinose dehydrogenase